MSSYNLVSSGMKVINGVLHYPDNGTWVKLTDVQLTQAYIMLSYEVEKHCAEIRQELETKHVIR